MNEKNKFDKNLYSRQILTYGLDAMDKIINLKILYMKKNQMVHAIILKASFIIPFLIITLVIIQHLA